MELSCKICPSKFDSVQAFLLHFDFNHRLSATARFSCGVESCCATFFTHERFESHVRDFHKSPQPPAPSVNQNSPPYSCNIGDCHYQCNVKSTLRVHRKRKHGQGVESPSRLVAEDLSRGAANADNELPLSSNNDSFACPDFTYDVEPCIVPLEQETAIVPKDEIFKKIIHFYMSINSKYHVPDSTIQYMISSVLSIAQESNKIVKEDILSSLRKAGIGIDQQIDDAVKLALSNGPFIEAHGPKGPVRSAYMRKVMYKSGLFTHIAAQSRKLGLNQINEKRRCHIVSIKQTIEAMFKDDSIYEQYIQMQDNRCSQDEFIRDIFDGSLCKNHPVLSKDGTAIGILLDSDDLEIASALGAAQGLHKVTSVAYTLSNFQPWCRMKQDIIKLCMLVAEKDVSYFGLEKVLEPLIEELSELSEKGVDIRGKNVKVVLLMLLGDNLGTHTWTGLIENFSSSTYFCRYCEEPRHEWRLRWQGNLNVEYDEEEEDSGSDSDSDTTDSEEPSDVEVLSSCSDSDESTCDLSPWSNASINRAPMRSPESYNQCLEELKLNKKKPSVDKLKGIVGFCELNKLKDFNWVGASPPCIAHDLFEGVIAYDVPLVLEYLYQKTGLTPQHINSKLKSLKMLGADQGSKPAKVKAGMKKLRGGAVQNWNFLRFFPFLVGNKIKNAEGKVCKMLLLLTQITRVLTSPTARRTALPDLKEKISLYLKMRCCLFPKVPLRPKHHFLEHYADLIEKFGCLMRVNTLGFESKHRFFKNTAAAKKNFKNITKLLSEEHQLCQSAISVDSLTCNFPTIEDAAVAGSVNFCHIMRETVISFFGRSDFESLMCSEKVDFHGRLYRKGEALIISETPLKLCLIEHVFVLGLNCYAAGEPQLSLSANPYFL